MDSLDSFKRFKGTTPVTERMRQRALSKGAVYHENPHPDKPGIWCYPRWTPDFCAGHAVIDIKIPDKTDAHR